KTHGPAFGQAGGTTLRGFQRRGGAPCGSGLARWRLTCSRCRRRRLNDFRFGFGHGFVGEDERTHRLLDNGVSEGWHGGNRRGRRGRLDALPVQQHGNEDQRQAPQYQGPREPLFHCLVQSISSTAATVWNEPVTTTTPGVGDWRTA